MKIFIEKTSETRNIKFNGKAAVLLKRLKINPEAVLVVKNDTLITDEDTLENDDEIKIVSVISGG